MTYKIHCVQTVKREFGEIKCLTTELHVLTDQLANYFCEDEAEFNLQEAFTTLVDFCRKLQTCRNVRVCIVL